MSYLRRAWKWVKAHPWRLLAGALGSLVAMLLLRGRPPGIGTPTRKTSKKAEDAAERARVRAARLREDMRRAKLARQEADHEKIRTARSRHGGVESLADSITSGRGNVDAAKPTRNDKPPGPRGRPVP